MRPDALAALSLALLLAGAAAAGAAARVVPAPVPAPAPALAPAPAPAPVPATRPAPTTRYLALCDDISPGLGEWERSFRADPRAKGRALVMVSVHGRTGKDGKWWAHPGSPLEPVRMEVFLRKVRERNKGAAIVLISCNEGRHEPGVPGVFYAKLIVSSRPDPNPTPERARTRAVRPDQFLYSGPGE